MTSRSPFLALAVLLFCCAALQASPNDELAQSLWNLLRMGSGQVQLALTLPELGLSRPVTAMVSWRPRDDGRLYWRLEGVLEEGPGPLSFCAVSDSNEVRVLFAAPGRPPFARLFPIPQVDRGPNLLGGRRHRGRHARLQRERATRPPRDFRRRLGRHLQRLSLEKLAPFRYRLRDPKRGGWTELHLDGTKRLPVLMSFGDDGASSPRLTIRFEGYRKLAAFDESFPLGTAALAGWKAEEDPKALLGWLADVGFSRSALSEIR